MESNSFEVLLFLFSLTLKKLDLKNGADYISGKMILELGPYFYRKDLKEDNIEYRVKDDPIWLCLNFWEEYFWDTIAVNFKNFMPDSSDADFSQKEKLFLKRQLSKFSGTMLKADKIATEIVEQFVEYMAHTIGLEPAHAKEITDELKLSNDP